MPTLESLTFNKNDIHPYFLRMKSAEQAIKHQLLKISILLIDTSSAAILGCLKDPVVCKEIFILTINIVNSHIIAALLKRKKLLMLWKIILGY